MKFSTDVFAASMQYSPFTSILKVLVETSDKDSARRIASLLRSVLADNSVLQNLPKSFNALLSSLEDSESETLHKQLVFIDNCVSRVAKKPVHYLDLIGSMSQDEAATSPLVAAIVEQWPFVVKAGDESAEIATAAWIAKLLAHLKQAGENSAALKAARDALVEATETKKTRSLIKKCFKGQEDVDDEDKMDVDSEPVAPTSSAKTATVDLDEIFGFLPSEGTTHNALHRWEREDLEQAVEQGRIAELMLCLCSEHEEVRRQAFAKIARFMGQLKVGNNILEQTRAFADFTFRNPNMWSGVLYIPSRVSFLRLSVKSVLESLFPGSSVNVRPTA
jgi:nucleolar pre-ribosomal-associated protein 1